MTPAPFRAPFRRETIRIGHDIEVTVMRVKGTQVRIGINAPKEIPVHRGDNYLRIRLNKTVL